MALIDRLTEKLQRHPKRVVFPEGSDPRIIQAARSFATKRLGAPILLGDRTEIKSRAERLDIRMDGIRILEPERSEDIDLFLPMIQELPRFSKFDVDSNKARLLQKNYFAAMMLMTGRADALVSGATTQASSALRPIFQIVPLQDHVKTASSMLLLDMDEKKFGVDGALFLADCGVIPEPDSEQLADIAVTTADIAGHLTGTKPKVAFLSWATRMKKEPLPECVVRVRAAVARAFEKASAKGVEADFEGEMQVDAALVPEVAAMKGLADSPVGGQAGVLVFPDLNCGNIVSKMVQIIAGARGYGQILTGLQRPCAEISRGAHAYDILGTTIIVACQAIDRHFLYGTESNGN